MGFFFSFCSLVTVPTNYRIKVSKEKASCFSKDDDDDKNLGRWVNRQRSMKQAGKLRKDRQLALEKIGLKWSMLATTSWESMFDTLCEYVEEKRKGGTEWDGNVPANYKTEDEPPRALGRWINRQRSAYGKKKLKGEYVSKLNKLGLKWSVHERRPGYQNSDPRPDSSKSSELAEEQLTSIHKDDGSESKDDSSNSEGEAEVAGTQTEPTEAAGDTLQGTTTGTTVDNNTSSERNKSADKDEVKSKSDNPEPSP
jgi:hypothetical protein